MKLDFHNSAMVRAAPRLINKTAGWKQQNFPIRYGLLQHPTRGLVLIDTGYSPALFESRNVHVMLYRNLLRPHLIEEGDAVNVVKALGAKVEDVRHIILTHLHADHMCGLERFPCAEIHASAQSLNGWQNPSRFSSPTKGYFPSLLPAVSERKVFTVESAKAVSLPWGGFGHDVFGDGSIISVDLPGHMQGHMGLFFPKLEHPIFFGADADWTFSNTVQNSGLTLAARMISDDAKAVERSKTILRAAHELGFKISLSHDAT